MTFVKNKDDAFISQRHQTFLVIATVFRVEGDTQFLNGGDNDFVGIILGKHSAHKCIRIGVFLHTTILEFVEFLAGLLVEVLVVHNKQAFLHIRIVFQKR